MKIKYMYLYMQSDYCKIYNATHATYINTYACKF